MLGRAQEANSSKQNVINFIQRGENSLRRRLKRAGHLTIAVDHITNPNPKHSKGK